MLKINELLQLDNETFIENAYQEILLRQADEGGFSNYLKRINEGLEKAKAIIELRVSPEGMMKAVFIDGLKLKDYSVNDLLRYDGASFATAVYLALFGRVPTYKEEEVICALLDEGVDKIDIIKSLIEIKKSELVGTKLISKGPKTKLKYLIGSKTNEKVKESLKQIKTNTSMSPSESSNIHNLNNQLKILSAKVAMLEAEKELEVDSYKNKYLFEYQKLDVDEFNTLIASLSDNIKEVLDLNNSDQALKETLKENGMNVVTCKDINKFLYCAESSSFDLVFSLDNLDYLSYKELDRVFNEIYRVLDNNGLFVIRVADRDKIYNESKKLIKYSIEDIKELIERAGFSDISINSDKEGMYSLLVLKKQGA